MVQVAPPSSGTSGGIGGRIVCWNGTTYSTNGTAEPIFGMALPIFGMVKHHPIPFRLVLIIVHYGIGFRGLGFRV
jgi:hypothetical protein